MSDLFASETATEPAANKDTEIVISRMVNPCLTGAGCAIRDADVIALGAGERAGGAYARETDGAIRPDRKSTRLNSSHLKLSRMPSSA